MVARVRQIPPTLKRARRDRDRHRKTAAGLTVERDMLRRQLAISGRERANLLTAIGKRRREYRDLEKETAKLRAMIGLPPERTPLMPTLSPFLQIIYRLLATRPWVSAESIVAVLYGSAPYSDHPKDPINNVSVLISKLRSKIAPAETIELIHCEESKGYRLVKRDE